MKVLLLSLAMVVAPGFVFAGSAKAENVELIYSCKPLERMDEGDKNLENYADFEIVKTKDGKFYAYSPSNMLSDSKEGGAMYSTIPNFGFGRKKSFDMAPEKLEKYALQVKVAELSGEQLAKVNTKLVHVIQNQTSDKNFLGFYRKAMVVSTVARTPIYLHPRFHGDLVFNDFMILTSKDPVYPPEVHMISGSIKQIWKTHICDKRAQ